MQHSPALFTTLFRHAFLSASGAPARPPGFEATVPADSTCLTVSALGEGIGEALIEVRRGNAVPTRIIEELEAQAKLDLPEIISRALGQGIEVLSKEPSEDSLTDLVKDIEGSFGEESKA